MHSSQQFSVTVWWQSCIHRQPRNDRGMVRNREKNGAAFSKTGAVRKWRISIMTFGLLAPKLHCVLVRIPLYSYIIQIRRLRLILRFLCLYTFIYFLTYLPVCICVYLCDCVCVYLWLNGFKLLMAITFREFDGRHLLYALNVSILFELWECVPLIIKVGDTYFRVYSFLLTAVNFENVNTVK